MTNIWRFDKTSLGQKAVFDYVIVKSDYKLFVIFRIGKLNLVDPLQGFKRNSGHLEDVEMPSHLILDVLFGSSLKEQTLALTPARSNHTQVSANLLLPILLSFYF